VGRDVPFEAGQNILAPQQLLRRSVSKSREDAIPAFRALNLMKERWKDLDRSWGPGGSVGFELAAGGNVAKAESDLDIVIYADGRITPNMAKSLHAQNAKPYRCCRCTRGDTFMRLFSKGIRVAESRGNSIADTERDYARDGPVG
jgi:hypothetical protein